MSAIADETQPISEPSQLLCYRGCIDLMHERSIPFFEITPIQSELNRGANEIRSEYLENFVVGQSCIDASIIRRTKSQCENAAHLVVINRYVSGSLYGQMGDTNIDREFGHVYLTDHERRIDCIQNPTVNQFIYVPKSVIGYDSAIHSAFIRFADDPVIGALISAEFDTIFSDFLSGKPANRVALRRLVACVKLAISSDQIDTDVRRHFRESLCQGICYFIENNLDNWDLSVGLVLKNFGVSRATLYRMFEEKGGVRQYISDRRLHRAVMDLSDSAGTRGAVTAISDKWGFSSGANFNRAIRRKFGIAPGALFSVQGKTDFIPDVSHGQNNFLNRTSARNLNLDLVA